MHDLRVAFLGLILAAAAPAQDGADAGDARRTALVRLVERCVDAVVSIRVVGDGAAGAPYRVGSGSIVHRDGYVLTNQHVVDGAQGGSVHLFDGRALSFEVVGSLPHEDLAVLRVRADGPLPGLPLGRSDDLMLGEPVIAIGDAAALPFTVSRGIVSGLLRSTATERVFLPSMVQTDAAISGGNSGGPLINALGQQIGVVTSRKDGAENIAFAITVDRVRSVLAELLEVEARAGYRLGVEVDPLAEGALVRAVQDGSAAAVAGLAVGDIITGVADGRIGSAADFLFAMRGRAAGETVLCTVQREGEELAIETTLADYPLVEPVAVDDAAEPGLAFAVHHGAWDRLPDFSKLEPFARGVAEQPKADVHGERPDDYALVFTGFVEVPRDGAWQFATSSDDGSRLWIGGDLVVDNDGLHGAQIRAGIRRLRAGRHPIRVEFFERGGAASLEVSFAGPQQPWTRIPGSAFTSMR